MLEQKSGGMDVTVHRPLVNGRACMQFTLRAEHCGLESLCPPPGRQGLGAHPDTVHAYVAVDESERCQAAARIRPGAGQRGQRVVVRVQADQLRVARQHIRQRPACQGTLQASSTGTPRRAGSCCILHASDMRERPRRMHEISLAGGASKQGSAIPCQHVAVGLHVNERQRGKLRWDASCTTQSPGSQQTQH